jgi:putative membrane protein insertion efficiency factor
MSQLQRLAARPWFWLASLAVVGALVVADSCRDPSAQVLVSAASHAIHGYQRYGRPVLAKHIVCRYSPTCSEYALQAFKTHGFVDGGRLSIERLARCKRSVATGTPDPLREGPGPIDPGGIATPRIHTVQGAASATVL